MTENFDLSNLTLDDNSYTSVPEGDYKFTVSSYDIDFSTSDKYPENTREITVHMDVPYKGEVASVRKSFPVCSKMLWLLRQFLECIGLAPEKGRIKMPDPEKMVGCSGIFRLTQGVSAKGNEYNNVDVFYAPSKAPAVYNNAGDTSDDGFKPVDEAEVNPFV